MGGLIAPPESLEPLTDDELAEAALAADPEAEVPDDAKSFWELTATGNHHLLPDWYMPPPMAGPAGPRRWWRWVAVVIIVAFVAIEAYGLCSTFGGIVPA